MVVLTIFPWSSRKPIIGKKVQPYILLGSVQAALLTPTKRPTTLLPLVLAAAHEEPVLVNAVPSVCVGNRQPLGQGLIVQVASVMFALFQPLTVPVAAHAVFLFHW